MSLRVPPTWILPALLAAGFAGYLVADHGSATAAAPTSPQPTDPATASVPASSALPPNHPAVPGMARGARPGAMPNGENQKPPSIDWTVPAGWQTAPNANPMRLATYRVGAGGEMSVARAGGPLDANILRWSQQFEGTPSPDRSEKEVHGLHVTIIRLAGTYKESGMGMAAPETHEGWAMLAAIVDAPGAPYFFKLLGPAAAVDGARASFDALVASVAPRATP